ncbi:MULTISPECIES: family 2 encapsulin nanocompartment cargo protein terpene cyclase [unclassified Streptomyces]|uniref:family 2 encapsulin nanocompartment cargo protein terpene cyclase n=1 Tax=unclassified Streptomyces TaxID=2593676 RepID=UPI00166091ED|nr:MULTISPECIES: family 2 encapsulin nanocompartment cargo protein terpene cyclase [unclassified Streptomyces]MBD0707835.1 2-methylisoborneol synthase [Streptomyces sp. CBMA291]MBD0717257.1 2-methylisoborneol synthase [Streptomyces sp. CBMA370]
MPEPGLSPLPSSLPSVAVLLGSRALAEVLADAPAGTAVIAAATAPTAPVPTAVPAPEAAPAPTPTPAGTPAPGWLPSGPTGLGTATLSLARHPEPPAAPEPPAPVAGRPVPGLYFHPIAEPDPVRVEEVSRRIKDWAVDEVQLFPDDWEGEFDGFSVGRYMVACHPDAPSVDHVMLATRLMVAENAVDDCYCEDHGGSPVGLGGRLLLAHTALDPLHTTEEYAPRWAESLHADAPRRAYRSAMEYFVRQVTPSQADRYRHDMARLHMGYLAEAAWSETEYMPEVWEYLAMRQFNNFRPCPTLTDSIGGYELPADLHAQSAMQRVIALAGNATTIVNDLYSYMKELDSPGTHLNLPVVIAEREGLSDREGYLKAVEVHNDLMHAFESEAAALALACPVPTVQRFLRGVAAWVDGNHYWHQTNTYRYSLPDFW